MGQSEVFDFLKKNRGVWFSCRELSSKLDINRTLIQRVLKALRKGRFISMRVEKRFIPADGCYGDLKSVNIYCIK